MDLEKEILQLKAKISELEASKKNNLFGSTYNNAGSSSADFLIKTKGKVKIQYGSKFIDLIKDGKINVDAKFIYKEKEVGVKDGIYVIGEGEDSRVVLLINGTQIDLKGDVGTTYVSFLGPQETSSDGKHIALTNIGFIYPSLQDIKDTSLKDGIIYIESEQKLYIVQGGQLSEYEMSIPTPYSKQFIIAKEDSNEGALVIYGEGIYNSIAFDSFHIYEKDSDGCILTKNNLKVLVNGNQKMIVKDDIIICSNPVSSTMFQSIGASQANGFRLYDNGSQSTLEVDNLVVRNSTDNNTLQTLPEYWYSTNNIINSASYYTDDIVEETALQFTLKLKYANEFQEQDKLKVYAQYIQNSLTVQDLIPLVVLSVNSDNNSIRVKIDQSQVSAASIDQIGSDSIISGLSNQILFLTERIDKAIPTVNHEGFAITKGDKKVVQAGTLDELEIKVKEQVVTGIGLYTDQLFLKKASYIDTYTLEPNDKSQNFASTEWVQKYINNLFPSGSIIMFNGQSSTIPQGWAICDGKNGTPNLIGKFIKASDSSGKTGGNSRIELSVDNLPKHSHSIPELQGTAISAGEHTHTTSALQATTKVAQGDEISVMSAVTTVEGTTSSNGSHTHGVTIESSSTGYTGTGTPLEWEPPYYSLIYIMKL